MHRTLKISTAVCLLILAVASAIGWRVEHRLASSRERNAKLILQAAALGISARSEGNRESVVLTKRAREDQQADERREVGEVMAMIREADAIEGRGNVEEDALRKVMGRITGLSATGAEMLFNEVLEMRNLKANHRLVFLITSIRKLAKDSPSATIRLLPKMSGIYSNKNEELAMRTNLLRTALGNWGKMDPLAAAARVRANGATFPESITENTRCGILAGAVARDPDLAFRLIGELEIKDKGQAVLTIGTASKTAEERTATLAALRRYLVDFSDERSRGEASNAAVGALASGALKEGFGPATRWLTAAKLSAAETDAFIPVLAYSNTQGETGDWIGWLGKTFPDKADEGIAKLMDGWTQADHQAAGNWLAAAPAGPGKDISVQTYAVTVSKYDPEVATQWAMTMPAGADRNSTLKQIHQNWPKEDSVAKEVFAREHGLK